MKRLAVLFCMCLSISFNVMALDVKQRFDHLDRNKDGYLTKNELDSEPQLLNQFKRWDTNKDNKISLEEFKNYLTNTLY